MNISFKGYIPVKCYAKDKGDEKYRRVYYDNYLKNVRGKLYGILTGH